MALLAAALLMPLAPASEATSPGLCGSVLLSGSSWLGGSGVDVRSNGSDEGTGASCAGSNSVNGVWTGSEWQCTELVNRLYLSRGWTTSTWAGNGGDSSPGSNDSMYARAPANLNKNSNGSVSALSPGDVVSINVFYNGAFQSDGHVAIVNTTRTVTSGAVELVSQNSGSPASATPQITASLSSGTITISGGGGWSYSVIGVVHAPASAQHRRSAAYGPVDFNHDGVSDYAIDSGGQWAAKSGATGAYIAQGLALGDGNCAPMVGDMDGDGVSDYVVDCGGQWAAKSGATGAYVAQGLALGDGNCAPMVGDLNKDGAADIAVDCAGQWAARNVAGPYIAQGASLGDANCTPFVGDYNGDGYGDFAVDCAGQWAAKTTSGSYIAQGISLGGSADQGLSGMPN